MYTKRAVESQRVLLASLFFSVICPEETVRDSSCVLVFFTENYRLKKEKMYAKK